MVIQHRPKLGYYYFRPLCKECNNARERGHRREYKRNYLRRWRRENAELDRSYWKDNPAHKEASRIGAYRRFNKNHDALLIQGRMNRRGHGITLAEAKDLLEQYGRCYPSRIGLTRAGLKRCEAVRSRLRHRTAQTGRRMLSAFEIRLMVYEESLEDKGLVIPPDLQPVPYKKASNRLKQWHRNQRIIAGEKEDQIKRRAA